MQTDKIKSHPIYKEAMHKYWRWFSNMVTCIVLLMILLISMCHYVDVKSGQECVKRCQTEHLSDNCNDFCY